MSRTILRTLTLLALCALISPVSRASAQGATTSGLTGIVKDPQDAVIPGVTVTAVHVPSSTTYEAVTQTDGRYFIPGMRVGGPYKVTATLSGFRTAVQPVHPCLVLCIRPRGGEHEWPPGLVR